MHPSTSVHSAIHIKVDGVSFSYPGRRVLTDVNFAVPAGKVAGLIGENGSGKSTLLGVISGELEPDVGEVLIPPRTGFIAQEVDLRSSDPAQMLIDASVAEVRELEDEIERLSSLMAEGTISSQLSRDFDLALSRAEQSQLWSLDSRIETVLAGLGLADIDPATPIGRMSGGQRRRFALAALLLRPVDALILDEPTNHLDDNAVDFLIQELQAFQGPVLVATHDRFFLDECATNIIDMDPALAPEGGKGEATTQATTYTGSFSEYLRQRERIRQQWISDYNAQENERARLENKVETSESDIFHSSTSKSESRITKKFYGDRAAKTTGNRIRSARNQLEELERFEIPAPPPRLHFEGVPDREYLGSKAATPKPVEADRLIVAKHAAVAKRLKPVTFALSPHQHLLVTGPNGSGKSTLMGALTGAVPLTEGSIEIGENVRLGFLAQDDMWIDLDRTAENYYWDAVPPKSPSLVDLGLMSEETTKMPIGELSLGQRRRVSLGIVLASPPDVLLLDEPTNHLSLALSEELETAVQEFEGIVILVSHDRWIRQRWGGLRLDISGAEE